MFKTRNYSILLSVTVFIITRMSFTDSLPRDNSRLNVLFMMSDDLRPELGCYLDKTIELRHLYKDIKTPNIDKFAKGSMLFTHAFSQYPLCNPSRTSLLTGRSPQVTRVMGNIQSFKSTANFITLPRYFSDKGYTTIHTGKIFHESGLDFDDQWQTDLQVKYNKQLNKFPYGFDQELKLKNIWKILENETEDGDRLRYDDLRVAQAIHYLKEIKKDPQRKPFFMGVGFLKTHLPLMAKKRFFDMYPLENIKPPANYYKPKNFPGNAEAGFCEMRKYAEIQQDTHLPFSEKNSLSKKMTLNLRRAYYSTVSAVDYNVGRILDALKETGFDKNTVVVLTADHGYHLGENNHWCKLKLLDLDLRVPLIIRVPGMTDGGMISNEVVELLDIFPTITELAGLPAPQKCSRHDRINTKCVEGKSLKYLMQNQPARETNRHAFSVVTRHGHKFLGYTVRDKQFRYTEWLNFNNKTFCPDFKTILGKELYHIVKDPENNENVVGKAEYTEVVHKYSSLLRVAWGGDCLKASQTLDRNRRENMPIHTIGQQGNRSPPKRLANVELNSIKDSQGRITASHLNSFDKKITMIGAVFCLILILFVCRFRRHFKVGFCCKRLLKV